MVTNPPVPATPLDVEACVRLLKRFVWASAMTPVGWSTPGVYLTKEEQALIDALASALPGMGKKADWYDWLADDDHVDWVRRLGNGNFAVETPPFGMKPDIERATLGECIAAARAAPYTPEEVAERIADNEACVQPETHIRRWAATVAALTAENERLTTERDDLRALLDGIACESIDPAEHRRIQAKWLAMRRESAANIAHIRAALPSSRGTTEPPPDKTREIL